MGRNSYLGGSTILGWNSVKTEEVTARSKIEGVETNSNPKLTFSCIANCRDIVDLFEFCDFEEVCEVFIAFQHGFIYNDYTKIIHLAKSHESPHDSDKYWSNHLLQIANLAMHGRTITRDRGEIIVVSDGPLNWSTEVLVCIYKILLNKFEPEYCEMPVVANRLKREIR